MHTVLAFSALLDDCTVYSTSSGRRAREIPDLTHCMLVSHSSSKEQLEMIVDCREGSSDLLMAFVAKNAIVLMAALMSPTAPSART